MQEPAIMPEEVMCHCEERKPGGLGQLRDNIHGWTEFRSVGLTGVDGVPVPQHLRHRQYIRSSSVGYDEWPH